MSDSTDKSFPSNVGWEALLVAAITVAAYSLAYSFELGRAYYLGYSGELISIELNTIVFGFAMLIVVIVFFLILSDVFIDSFRIINSSFRKYILYSLPPISLFVLAYFLVGMPFGLAASVSLEFLAIYLSPLVIKTLVTKSANYFKPFILKNFTFLIADDEDIRKNPILFPNSYLIKTLIFSLVILFVSGILSFSLGVQYAHWDPVYEVYEKDRSYLVLRVYSEYIVIGKYDPTCNSVGHNYKIVPRQGNSTIGLITKITGPLSPSRNSCNAKEMIEEVEKAF